MRILLVLWLLLFSSGEGTAQQGSALDATLLMPHNHSLAGGRGCNHPAAGLPTNTTTTTT
jgi:hypothetical protein